MSHIPGLRDSRNTKNANLFIVDQHRVSQGQWPQMTFERPGYDVRGLVWSSSELNQAYCLDSSQWRQVKLFDTGLRWHLGQLLWRHISTTLLHPGNFLPKVVQRIFYELCHFQRDPPSGSEAILEKLMGSASRSARVRVKFLLCWAYVQQNCLLLFLIGHQFISSING